MGPLRQLAKDNPRYGYRPFHAMLTREGRAVNHKRVQRLCREEYLRCFRLVVSVNSGLLATPVGLAVDDEFVGVGVEVDDGLSLIHI